ncbi:Ces3 (predicted) [Pycnogonum litorale]
MNLFLWCLMTATTITVTSTDVKVIMNRVVRTRYGSLRGRVVSLDNPDLHKVEQYLGVPYASPPVDNLRFMPPVTCNPWRNVRSADSFRPVCPQKLPRLPEEDEHDDGHIPSGRIKYLKRLFRYLQRHSEDCLYLNIYKPAQVGRAPKLLPVMVFIHGESYSWNSGNPYDGSVLASVGHVVVVTLNYRLGILGFMTTMDDSSRGNYGLMDQIAALHWLEENISLFGGDPSNVTIFGHGTGAACAHFLMISPVAKGLFHRVIMMSGSALGPRALTRTGVRQTISLAQSLGCPVDDSQNLVDCLRKKSLQEIMDVADIQVPFADVAFGPIVDGIIIPDEPLVYLEDEENKYRQPKYDLMIGTTKIEDYFNISSQYINYGLSPSTRNRILSEHVRSLSKIRQKELLVMITNEYTDWTKTNQHPINILDSVLEVLGDSKVISPTVRTANIHSERNNKTYFYIFGYQTKLGDYSGRLGCIHGEDLPYVFGAPLLRSGLSHFSANYSTSEYSLSESVITIWASFARNGDPSVRNSNHHRPSSRSNKFGKLVWPRYDVMHQKYLNVNIRPRIRDHYRAHKLSIWLNLIPQLEQIPIERVTTAENRTSSSSYDVRIPWRVAAFTESSPVDVASTTETSDQLENETSIDRTGTKNDGGDDDDDVNYSTALSLTIIVGCSLLVLNVLSFAAMYYQQRKFRRDCKMHKESCHDKNNVTKESPITPTFYHHHEHHAVQNRVLPAIATIKRATLLDRNDDMANDWTNIYNMTPLNVQDDKFTDDEPNAVSEEEEEETLLVDATTTDLDSNSKTAGTQV